MLSKFDKYQLDAYNACFNTTPRIFITGDGGTGKTAIIKAVVKEYNKRGIEVILLAPTNSASKNIKGRTLHNFFGFKSLENIEAKNEEDFIFFDNYLDDDELGTSDKVLIIDEVSMVGKKLLAKTIDKVEATKIILFGDLQQLPPPKDNAVNWETYVDEVYKLVVNYRATNPTTKQIIDLYKDTKVLSNSVEEFSKLDFTKDTKIIAYRNATLSTLQKSIKGYDNGMIGDKVILSGTIFNNKKEKIFDNGDEVVLRDVVYLDILNNTNLRCFTIDYNTLLSSYPPKVILGDYAEYKELRQHYFSKFQEVMNLLTNKYNKSKKDIWKMYSMKKLEFREQLDLKNSYREYMSISKTPYARDSQFITTYKAQGKGYKHVAVAIYDMPNNHHRYTAISRAIDKLQIISKG